MSSPDDAAQQWLDHAVTDFRAANLIHNSELDAAYLVTFLAQQSVEKSLKSFLAYREAEFPYSHDLTELIRMASDFHEWTDNVTRAKSLTRYAVDKRYPVLVGEPVTSREAEDAIEIAREAVREISSVLESEGLDASGLY